MSIFSERLTLARKSLKLTQQDVANKFQITRSAYGAWESGRNEPSFSFIFDFCRSTGISADYLIGLSDTMTASISTPVSIQLAAITRDPFDDLTDDQRVTIEAALSAFRAANAAKAQEA